MFSADFHTADCTKVDLETLFGDKKMTFDIVTSQFAFHYCFESIEQADCMLKNITNRLRPGGYFVGTTTDANDIGKMNFFDNYHFKYSITGCSLSERLIL